VEDQEAYVALTEARTQKDTAAFDVALRACVTAPRAVAATALALLELCDKLHSKVNRHLLSDLAICAELAMAVARSSVHNIRVNLTDVTDATWRAKIEDEAKQTTTHASEIIQRFSRRIS
jgi:formiminotetrahydrofolate cyclodeaminase